MAEQTLWMVCPVCNGLMLRKGAYENPSCDRCKQGIRIPPQEESETNH